MFEHIQYIFVIYGRIKRARAFLNSLCSVIFIQSICDSYIPFELKKTKKQSEYVLEKTYLLE